MKLSLYAICALTMLVTMDRPAMAWMRRSTAAADAAKAAVEAQARTQAANRARIESQVRLHETILARYRLTAMLRANALAAQRREIEAAERTARAQGQIVATLPTAFGGVHDKALAKYRKWVDGRRVLHQFQGAIPPEELRRFEPAEQSAPADGQEQCAAEDKKMHKPRDCSVPGS